jgi:WD40 repeat protein
MECFSAATADFSMNVYDLQAREVIFSTKLLSPNVDSDLGFLATTLLYEDGSFMSYDDPVAGAKLESRTALLGGIDTLAWSPDGSTLAYASQLHGPSSDLYFFTPSTHESWRVSSELDHVQSAEWSPNSAFVAITAQPYYTHGFVGSASVFSRTGEYLLSPSEGLLHGWANSSWIVQAGEADAYDPFRRLLAVKVTTGQSTPIADTAYDYAFSPDMSSTVISRANPPDPDAARGLFYSFPGSPTPVQLSPAVGWDVEYWGSPTYPFAAAYTYPLVGPQQQEGVFGITQDHQLKLIDTRAARMSPAPDGSRLALFAPGSFTLFEGLPSESSGLRLVDELASTVTDLTDEPVRCVRWRHDSSGLAFLARSGLYYWSEGLPSPILVDATTQLSCDFPQTFDWTNE